MNIEGDTRHLTGIRGVAALLVLVSHMANQGLLPDVLGGGLGRIGVAIFFVLSGYLMAALYLNRPISEHLRGYLVARFARVLPLYWLLLTISWAATSQGFTYFVIVEKHQYLAALSLLWAPSIFWTIPVEVQYYLVFVGLWALHGWFGKVMFAAISVFIAIACLLGSFASGISGSAAHYLPFWLSFFVFGSLLGGGNSGLMDRITRHYASWLRVSRMLLLTAVVYAVPGVRRFAGVIDPAQAPDAWNSAAAWAGVAAIFTLACVDPVGRRVFAHPLLLWVGNISYSLYLGHMIVLLAVLQVMAPETTTGTVVAAILVFVGSGLLATALTEFFEMPARDALRDRLRFRQDAQ